MNRKSHVYSRMHDTNNVTLESLCSTQYESE